MTHNRNVDPGPNLVSAAPYLGVTHPDLTRALRLISEASAEWFLRPEARHVLAKIEDVARDVNELTEYQNALAIIMSTAPSVEEK